MMLLTIIFIMHCYLSCDSYMINKRYYCKRLDRQTYVCDGNSTMNWIPKPPFKATVLEIHNGNFLQLTKQTFINITQSSIKTFKMKNCRIKNITKDAFTDLKKIEELDLSKNYESLSISVVAQSLHSLANSSISKLHLNWMKWNNLSTEMFDGLISTNISEIYLTHNLFRHIKGKTFKNLKSLRLLDLSWNGLADGGIKFSGLSQIKTLFLSGNWFYFVPNFCDTKNKSYLPNLVELRLDNTKIQSLNREITCLDKLQNLNLTGITIRRLHANTFSQLKTLKVLTLHKLGSQLLIINATAFNSSSLLELRFSVAGGYHFSNDNQKHFKPDEIFQHCSNLTLLDLSYNSFHLNTVLFQKIFKPLKKLKSLILKNTKIKSVPNFGKLFRNLEQLDLSSNKIKYWKGSEPFDSLKSLTKLNLKGNKISVINETSFPKSWIKGNGKLISLLLDDNPFSCTCDLSWFRKWMDTTESRNISTDKYQWTCSRSTMRVLDYHPSKLFECLVDYVVPSVVMFVVISVTVFIVYVCRWRIRLRIYKCTSRKKHYTRVSNDEFTYDCFVAYSYGDLYWVQNTLIQKMEIENNRRLCIRDRDFQLGTVFTNHIVESIEASRTVLLLISENFAKDKWCDFQFSVASHMNVVKGRPTLVPILLENISFKHMNEPIYKVLHTVNYLEWSQDETGEAFFWTKIMDYIPTTEDHEGSEHKSTEYSAETNDISIQD